MEQTYHNYSRWERGWAHKATITPNDLEYLKALHRHAYLSSNVLHAMVRPEVKLYETQQRLKILKRNPNGYIDAPDQQKRSHNANYRPMIYSLSRKGFEVLKLKGLAETFKPRDHVNFEHECMVSHILGNIELALEEKGLQFISWHDILHNPRCPKTTTDLKMPVTYSYEGKTYKQSVTPDALFGIRYKNGSARVFALEADRGTMPAFAENLTRSSFLRKVLQYRQIAKDEIYQRQFGIPNLMVLTVTVSPHHKQTLEATVKKAAEKSRMFLFKAEPSLEPFNHRLELLPNILSPWPRVGYDALDISKE